MNKLNKRLFFPLAYLFAFMCAVFFTPSSAHADEEDIQEIKQRLVLGKADSPIEIYIVSDWFCSSCKKLEPKIEQLYTALKSKAAFYFVDFPINRQSANFSPYHLSFLINEKPKYLTARQSLMDLTDETQKPTDIDVAKLAKTKKLKFEELSFEDVKNGTEFFDDIVKRYSISATPSVVVVNKETEKFEKFKGSQAKEKTILEAIDKLEGKTKPKKSWFSF